MNNGGMAFRDQLKALRLRAGMTQEQVGLALGWSQSRIANYEKGTREPTLDEVPLIASAIRCTVSELFICDDHQSSRDFEDVRYPPARLDVSILAQALKIVDADEALNGVYNWDRRAEILLGLCQKLEAGEDAAVLGMRLTHQRQKGEAANGTITGDGKRSKR